MKEPDRLWKRWRAVCGSSGDEGAGNSTVYIIDLEDSVLTEIEGSGFSYFEDTFTDISLGRYIDLE